MGILTWPSMCVATRASTCVATCASTCVATHASSNCPLLWASTCVITRASTCVVTHARLLFKNMPPGPPTLDPPTTDQLWANRVSLTSSFTLFGRSSHVTPKNFQKNVIKKSKKFHREIQNISLKNSKYFTKKVTGKYKKNHREMPRK